jgi:cathepsin L
VTPVRKQGVCGGCYSFAAAAAVEAQNFKKTGKLLSLSPQNLIDCTYQDPYDNLKCNGGYVDTCFKYIVSVYDYYFIFFK